MSTPPLSPHGLFCGGIYLYNDMHNFAWLFLYASYAIEIYIYIHMCILIITGIIWRKIQFTNLVRVSLFSALRFTEILEKHTISQRLTVIWHSSAFIYCTIPTFRRFATPATKYGDLREPRHREKQTNKRHSRYAVTYLRIKFCKV